MNKQEIVEKLLDVWGLDNDKQLGECLGVGRQGIYQWQQGKRQTDINTIIIERLIKEIEELKNK